MSAVFWIFIVVALFAVCCGSVTASDSRTAAGRRKGRMYGADGKRKILRIDHLHYYDLDEYECSVCGTVFDEDTMVCPGCGVRFTDTEEDDSEELDEFLEEEDWDEENEDD